MREVSAAAATGVRAADTAIAAIRAHLDRGAPWDACDAFREAIITQPANADLLYWGSLAHARAGATHVAHALLDQAEVAAGAASPARLADIASLRGRLWKDAFYAAPARGDAQRNLERARAQYARAYRHGRDSYPGINVATLSRLLGRAPAAQRAAREVLATLARCRKRTAWDLATEGEARLLLGNVDEAARCYAAAHRSAGGNAGIVAAMRKQVNLLARVIPDAKGVLRVLPTSDVIAFAGHMLDAPDRALPRFPPALVPRVRASLQQHIAGLRDPIVFTSAACGADLLFIEAAAERGAEVNIVLPFDRDDFVRTSVAVGGDEWVQRFDFALARAKRVVMATEENYLGDDVLFEHAGLLVEGLSMLRAAQLQTTPSLLCVLDAGAVVRVGGTQSSAERWARNVGTPRIIDLAPLRDAEGASGKTPRKGRTPRAPAHRRARKSAASVAEAERPARTLKTMLFADFAGYSKLHDTYAPLFQRRFFEIGASEIAASPAKPLEAKTWGDALYAVFASPREGADFALRFLERMLEVDWQAAGLSNTSQIRIALHAGPVFHDFDPVMGRDGHFGSSVTRAARIEPVTPPGMVYASEAFAATLASTGERDFALEYIGNMALAKGYGESRIYRLDRA